MGSSILIPFSTSLAPTMVSLGVTKWNLQACTVNDCKNKTVEGNENAIEDTVSFTIPHALPAFAPRLPFCVWRLSRISHLRYSGFLFYLMPVNFVIHAAHPVSLAKVAWKNADQQVWSTTSIIFKVLGRGWGHTKKSVLGMNQDEDACQ